MNYQLTWQLMTDEMPKTRTYETREEVEDQVLLLRNNVEETRIPFKIEPKVEVER